MKHDDESDEIEDDDMLPEYDFSNGVRGKYYEAYKKGTNVVLLEADVAEVFKDSTSVNSALREYIAEHGPPSSHKAG